MNPKCEYQGTECMRYQLSLQLFTMRQQRIYHAVCFILVGLLEVSFFINAARADQKDSLRNELNKATLTNTSRAKILEQIVLSTMDAHPDTAVHYAWQIYHIAQKDNANKNLLAEALTALVNGYQNYDKSDKVLEYGFQLLKLSEEIGDTARMGRALFAIGHASGQLSTKNIHSENNSALQYLQRALAIANTTNDNRLTTECLNAIGRIYRKEQQFDTAKVYHERALALAQKHHLPFQQAWALNSLATCYENKGDLRTALEYAVASLTSFEADGIGTIIAIPLNNIARLYQKLGNLPQALAYAKRSFLFAQKSQNRAALYMSCERIALIFEEIGDSRNALVYQKRFVVIRDSVVALERTEDLSALQSTLDYAYNKREKELHLREDEALKLAVQKQQIIIALIAIGCSLLALATFLLLRSLRSAKLLNVQLQTASSERIAMREKLHERGQHLETIIASLDDIIFEFDDTFHFLNVWCADASKLFFPPKQFLGKTIRETFGEEFAHIFESVIAESFALDTVQRIEYTTPFANQQTVRWFEGKIVPIKTEEGEQRRAALQVSDITERKEREQELQLIYNAVNRSSDAISIIQARTGNLIFANDRLCTNLFRTREDLLQTPVQQLETIFEQPGAWESHVEDMRNKRNAVAQGVQKRKDGSTFPVEVSVSLIEIGKEEFEVVITRDTTDRKKDEEQILAQSRFIRSVTDAIPGMLSYWTTDLRCTFANASYVKRFGKTLHEVIGIELQELVGNTRFKSKESYIQGALKGQPQQFEREILDENGESQFSLVQFIPDISEDRVLGFIILETDITSTKKVQNSLIEAQRLAHIGSWEWDISLNTLTWSDEQYHIFGEDIHTFKPTFETYFSHFTEEEQKRTARLLHEAISGAETYTIEHEITRLDGSRLFVLEQATVVYDYAKKPVRMFGTTQDITERKRSEEEVQKLSMVASKTTNCVVITDAQGYISWVNNSFMNLTEYSLVEVIGKKPGHLLQGLQTDPATVQTMREAFQRGEGFEVEILNYSKSKRPYWLHIKVDPITHNNGVISGFIAIQTNITERKRSEEELQKLSLVASKTTNAVAMTDEYGNIEWVNEGFTRITEYSFEEVVGKKPGQFLKGVNTDAATIQMINEAIRCGKGFEAELLNYTKSQQPLWLHIKADPIINSNGKLTGFIAIQTNITERKRAEEQQFQKLSLVASKTTNGVVITDPNGVITWVNEGFTSITEFPLDEVIGKIPEQIVQIFQGDSTAIKTIRTALEQGKGIDIELVQLSKSNRQYWVHMKTDPFYDEQLSLGGFVVIMNDITERKKAEEQLLESEERYRLIFEHSSEGVLQTLPNGTIETANPEACRILGRTYEELSGLSRADIVDMTDARLPLLRQERREKGFVQGELNFVRKDGTIFPGEFSSTMYKDAQGAEHIAVFLRDVSDRKKAEEAIRKSEAWLSTSLQALSEGIMIIDTQSETRICNKSAELITGLTADQINFQVPIDPNWKTIHEDGSIFRHENQPSIITLNTGKPQTNVIMGIQKPNGILTWISANSRPIYLRNDTEYSGAVISFTDITDQKEAERNLRFQTELLNSIILSMTDGVILVDKHHSIVLANPAAEAIFGYTNKELLAQPLSLLVPQQSRSVHEHHIQNFLDHETGSVRRDIHSVFGQRNSGETFPMEASIAQFTVDGRLFLLAVVRDITKRLETEEEILQLNRTLTQRVEDRTADLVKISKEKDEFFGIATHDLKNPLAVIRSSAQIIEECYRDKEEIDFAEYADSIIATCDEMLLIITSFLDIEQIESGNMGLVLENVSLEIVRKAILSHTKRAHEKEITIHFKEPNDAIFVVADKLALKQVLDNLMSNAIKFSQRSKNIFVRILEKQEEIEQVFGENIPNKYLRIEIQDEGPGLNEEDFSKIFKKFARLSAKPTGQESTTGLGLSIVKKLVEMMNGNVWCESQKGKGATFIVELPIF
jgi:PAS domain S-box-containing protein